MNVTQRKYTLERLNIQLAIKINALVAENDLVVKQSNKDFLITFDEFKTVVSSNPEVVTLVKTVNSSSLQADYHINELAVRNILNKSLVWLRSSIASYVDDSTKHLQQEVIIKDTRKCLLNEYAGRIKKVQTRAQYAKDQVMLGDAKEALAALEEFNSLVF